MRAKFSFGEIRVPLETVVTFDSNDVDIYGVVASECEINIFHDGEEIDGLFSLSGAAILCKQIELGDRAQKKYDGPNYWKLGELTLKQYRKGQRKLLAQTMTRDELEKFYYTAGSTGHHGSK